MGKEGGGGGGVLAVSKLRPILEDSEKWKDVKKRIIFRPENLQTRGK